LKISISILLLLSALGQLEAATSTAKFPPGTVVPRVTCLDDANQSYALYLPSKCTWIRGVFTACSPV